MCQSAFELSKIALFKFLYIVGFTIFLYDVLFWQN